MGFKITKIEYDSNKKPLKEEVQRIAEQLTSDLSGFANIETNLSDSTSTINLYLPGESSASQTVRLSISFSSSSNTISCNYYSSSSQLFLSIDSSYGLANMDIYEGRTYIKIFCSDNKNQIYCVSENPSNGNSTCPLGIIKAHDQFSNNENYFFTTHDRFSAYHIYKQVSHYDSYIGRTQEITGLGIDGYVMSRMLLYDNGSTAPAHCCIDDVYIMKYNRGKCDIHADSFSIGGHNFAPIGSSDAGYEMFALLD